MLLTLSAVVFGYIITRSLILGVITLFVVVMILFDFAVSYLFPRLQGRSKSLAYACKMVEEALVLGS